MFFYHFSTPTLKHFGTIFGRRTANELTRVVFKLVRDFSIAPYKPSDSAQKFDGPLNLASQVREAESQNTKRMILLVFQLHPLTSISCEARFRGPSNFYAESLGLYGAMEKSRTNLKTTLIIFHRLVNQI